MPLINKGQILHIKYTGEKMVCKDYWPANHKRNSFKQDVYWFEGKSFPIKEEQIRTGLIFKHWEVIDNTF